MSCKLTVEVLVGRGQDSSLGSAARVLLCFPGGWSLLDTAAKALWCGTKSQGKAQWVLLQDPNVVLGLPFFSTLGLFSGSIGNP